MAAAARPEGMQEIGAELSKGLKLKHVEPAVKDVLPTEQDIKAEKEHNSFLQEIEKGAALKDVEPVVKDALPTNEDIVAEKTTQAHIKGIEDFARDDLNATKTKDTSNLAARDYAAEKLPAAAASFDKTQLKHTEPVVKTLPVVVNE